MLVLTDVESLYRISDNELNKLGNKDRIIIFSRNGSQMPMSKFQALAAVKAKMEIIEYPAGTESMAEADQMIYVGYLFGLYAASVKQQEPVKIYSSLFDKLSKANVKAPGILKSMGKVQICGSDEKKTTKKTANKTANNKIAVAAKTFVKKTEKPVAEPEKTGAVKEKAAKAAEAPKKKATKSASKTSALIEKMCSLGLTDMKNKLIRNEEHLISAIRNADDAEIGYRFQLKMYFGEEDSAKIWDKTAKAFKQLKTLV